MVTGAYFPELSGAGLQCRSLIRALGTDVRASVLTTTTDASLPAFETVEGTPVHRVFVDPKRTGSVAAAAWKILLFWSKHHGSAEIVHLHGFSRKTMLVVLLARLFGKRAIIKLTSVGHDDPVSALRWSPLARWCYRQADRLVGVSPRFAALAGAAGLPPGRVTLIANGVDLERFRPGDEEERRSLRSSLGLPLERALVLFVGFFSPEKHPELLFEAWLRASGPAGPESDLVFIGATQSPYYEIDAGLAGRIKAEAGRRGLGARLHFIERAERIERYFRCVDVFVLPSSREGLPNALLEAGASGLACIASRLEGVTDALIEDSVSGSLVPVGDAEALARALRSLLCDASRRKAMGREARRRMSERYGVEQAAAEYRALYRALLDGSRRESQKANVRRAFDARADTWRPQYDSAAGFRGYCFETRRREVLDLLDSGLRGQRVLDVGCGTGDYLERLLARGRDVSALDASRAMVSKVVERFAAAGPGRLKVAEGDIEGMPYPDGVFDGVICAGVLEYLTEDSLALPQIRRILARGGVAVLTVPNILSPFVWMDRAAYGIVRLFGAVLDAAGLFEPILGKPRTKTVFRHRAYLPSAFDRELRRQGFEVEERRYGWFGSFALGDALPGAVGLSTWWERFSRGPVLGSLGMCYIVRVRKP